MSIFLYDSKTSSSLKLYYLILGLYTLGPQDAWIQGFLNSSTEYTTTVWNTRWHVFPN